MEDYEERRRIQNLNAQRKWREKRKRTTSLGEHARQEIPFESWCQTGFIPTPILEQGEDCRPPWPCALDLMNSCDLRTSTAPTPESLLDRANSVKTSDHHLLTPHSSLDISQLPLVNQMEHSKAEGRNGVKITNYATPGWNGLADSTAINGLNGLGQSSMESNQEIMERAVSTLQAQKRTLCQKIEELFRKILELYTHGVLLELLREDPAFQHQLLADKKWLSSLIQ
ncbi:uncharacterized protein N7500_006162 [Penicillium coprophilum]|uniref:uncharacterized protein n=1 Tax=Penicillium coprophilum TaxID=36646 RepID=UPI002384475E|nr:uncharacterized protein N7500_006162 [Penicillium coprophilum]KAJ5164332.1 hypothetical protein N7500_006162 [Penicillium coprophilum]